VCPRETITSPRRTTNRAQRFGAIGTSLSDPITTMLSWRRSWAAAASVGVLAQLLAFIMPSRSFYSARIALQGSSVFATHFFAEQH